MTPTPAASVLLVRDGRTGIEVFMLRRHLNSDFVGGAYVFPGGKVDDRDHEMPESTAADDIDAYEVAAVRETFEEAGVLLATVSGVQIDHAFMSSETTQQARNALAARDTVWDWRPWLTEAVVELKPLVWWAWWVTPKGVHRRFDTRFYLAEFPADQVAEHDNIETTDSMWIRPEDALARQARDEVSIILPTRKILASLQQHRTTAELIAYAVGLGPPERIEPVVGLVEGQPFVTHPSFDGPEAV